MEGDASGPVINAQDVTLAVGDTLEISVVRGDSLNGLGIPDDVIEEMLNGIKGSIVSESPAVAECAGTTVTAKSAGTTAIRGGGKVLLNVTVTG